MDNDVKAAFDAGNNFQQKLNDTLLGLISANNDRKSEIEALRGDHEELKKNHEAFVVTATWPPTTTRRPSSQSDSTVRKSLQSLTRTTRTTTRTPWQEQTACSV